jgi:hypothetical protein
MNVPALKRSLMDMSAPVNFYNTYIGYGEISNAPYDNTDELVNYVWRSINANPTFGPYDGSLNAGAKKINSRFTASHVSSVRTMELPYLRNRRIRETEHNISAIKAELGNSPNTAHILNVAAKYKLPPHYLLTLLGIRNSEVEALDLTSPLVNQKTKLVADQYEKDIENYLKKLNIEFKTEQDLKNEGSQLTPDFFLTKPVALSLLDPSAADGNTLIHWIDAKNYPMFNLRLTQDKLKNQALKYTNVFGYGAFIFSKGIASNAANVGAALINGERMANLALQGESSIN